MSTPRRSPALNLTLPPPVVKALERLARREARATGGDPKRLRSAVVARLVLAEDAARRAEKETDG